MKTIFDKKINRKKANERKWSQIYLKQNYDIDFSKKYYNLSIADLDFYTPKPIVKSIKKRANIRTYSYTYIQDESIDAIATWYQKLHNVSLEKKLIKLIHGTVNAMFEIVKCFTKENDSVLIQTPIYQPFERSILKTNRKIVYNKLIYKENNYFIDFAQFEKQIIDNKVSLFLWCNPHNPGGRVWRHDEILKIIEICNKHNVLIFADEIHGDLTLQNGHNSILKYKDIAQNFIIGNSPNKMFNLGGLKGSYLICSNKNLFDQITNQYEKDSLTTPNVFFQPALISAYTHKKCFDWALNLKKYVHKNYLFLKNQLGESSLIEIMQMNASYLVWIKLNHTISWNEVKNQFYKHNLIVSYSEEFGDCPTGWIRINIGSPRKNLMNIVNLMKSILSKI